MSELLPLVSCVVPVKIDRLAASATTQIIVIPWGDMAVM